MEAEASKVRALERGQEIVLAESAHTDRVALLARKHKIVSDGWRAGLESFQHPRIT